MTFRKTKKHITTKCVWLGGNTNYFHFNFSGDNFTVWQDMTSKLVLWTINIIFLLGCMVKLLVYGDPLLKSEHCASSSYWKRKQLAEESFSKVFKFKQILTVHFF